MKRSRELLKRKHDGIHVRESGGRTEERSDLVTTYIVKILVISYSVLFRGWRIIRCGCGWVVVGTWEWVIRAQSPNCKPPLAKLDSRTYTSKVSTAPTKVTALHTSHRAQKWACIMRKAQTDRHGRGCRGIVASLLFLFCNPLCVPTLSFAMNTLGNGALKVRDFR